MKKVWGHGERSGAPEGLWQGLGGEGQDKKRESPGMRVLLNSNPTLHQ